MQKNAGVRKYVLATQSKGEEFRGRTVRRFGYALVMQQVVYYS